MCNEEIVKLSRQIVYFSGVTWLMKETIGSCLSVERISFSLSPDAENKVQYGACILWNVSPCKLTYRYKRL